MKDPASMSRAEMRKELFALGKQWDELRSGDEELGGGSPGEWMIERMDELRTALRRDRKAAIIPRVRRG